MKYTLQKYTFQKHETRILSKFSDEKQKSTHTISNTPNFFVSLQV